MALNTSGAISLAGSTSGQSIALELGQSATGQISLNDSNVRTLAGVASGAIVMPTNFYGKSNIPAIGAAYQGGYFAGQISTNGNGVATHNLVVAPYSSGQSNKQWSKTSATGTTGANSSIDGPGNSNILNSTNYPAAYFCKGLTVGGYTDWYMPAYDELEICYYNLKPTTTSNQTSAGYNDYSVPRRNYNYTSGTPAQTGAATFQWNDFDPFSNNAFQPTYYWCSTEWYGGGSSAFWRRFSNGQQPLILSQLFYKGFSYNVRATRRVAV